MCDPTRRAHSRAGLLLVALFGACRAVESPAPPATVLTYTSPMWYEETGRYFQLAPDGRLAIYGSGPRSRLYDLATGKELHRFLGHQGAITSLVFSREGETLISSSKDTTVLLWSLAEQRRQSGVTPRTLTTNKLNSLWDKLSGPAAPAYQAMLILSAAPRRSVPFLKDHVKPTPERIAGQRAWVRELRAVSILERMATSEAREVLKTLAEGAADNRLTQEARASLQRLDERR